MDEEITVYLEEITKLSTPEENGHYSDSYQKLYKKYCDLINLAKDCLSEGEFSEESRIKINSLMLEIKVLDQEKIPTL